MIIAHRGPIGEALGYGSVVTDDAPGSVALGTTVHPSSEAPAMWTPGYGATSASHWTERVGADAAEQAEHARPLGSLSHDELLAKIDRDLVALVEAHEQADADDALEIDVYVDARARADAELAEIDEQAEAEAREVDAMLAWYDERDALAEAHEAYASVLDER